jgi:hypothetical protein
MLRYQVLKAIFYSSRLGENRPGANDAHGFLPEPSNRPDRNQMRVMAVRAACCGSRSLAGLRDPLDEPHGPLPVPVEVRHHAARLPPGRSRETAGGRQAHDLIKKLEGERREPAIELPFDALRSTGGGLGEGATGSGFAFPSGCMPQQGTGRIQGRAPAPAYPAPA